MVTQKLAELGIRIHGGKGEHRTTCPQCSHKRRKQTVRCLSVLVEGGDAKFNCWHCGFKGSVSERERGARPPDPAVVARAKAEKERSAAQRAEAQLRKARWLWRQRRPAGGTVVERYLRDARGYAGRLPETLGFLPARGDYPPAMIAAFGIPGEPEPRVLAIADDHVFGVHITRLCQDGSGKAGTESDKIMIGGSVEFPIVLAPPNDCLGLVITEGIEDALSVHEATGLGAWAAGCASRLPSISAKVPAYIESFTIMADGDEDGRRHSGALASLLRSRAATEIRLIELEKNGWPFFFAGVGKPIAAGRCAA